MGNADEVDPMQIDLTKLIQCRLVVVVVVVVGCSRREGELLGVRVAVVVVAVVGVEVVVLLAEAVVVAGG